jgi:hypothetical protein
VAAAVLVLAAGVYLPLQSATMAAAATCSPTLESVTLSPASVPGGASSTFTATLNCATPKALAISVKGFPGAKVPATLKVATGKKSGSVTITTATTKTARQGAITATLGKVSRGTHLAIDVTPVTCASPVLTSATLPALAYVGDHPVLAITLSCAASAPVRLSVTSSNANVPVPATVTIGKFYSAASVRLTPKALDAGQYTSTIAVSLAAVTLSAAITVDPGLAKLELTPQSSGPNDFSTQILFTGGLPAGGEVVALKSDNAAITVPATVAFTQQGSGGGDVLGVTVAEVTANTKVTLSATLGSVTLTASITLIPPWPFGHKITLTDSWAPSPVYGPTFSNEIFISLSNPAPKAGNGLSVTVTTDHPNDVQLDGSTAGIPPGWNNTTVSFSVPFETAPVHAKVKVTIGSFTASIPVTIEPSIASVTAPATIVGGTTATGTVTLAGATDKPDTVFLQSQSGILTTPNSVTIPVGRTSVTFPITTIPVDSDTQGGIMAWHIVGGSVIADSAFSNTIDVTPASA